MRQEFFGKVLPPGITIWVQKLLYSANSGQLEGLPILLCLWDVLNCNWIRLTSLYTHKLSRILINTLIYFTVRLTNLFVVLFQVSQRKRCVVGKRNRVSTKQLRVMSLALVVIPFSHLCTIQWSIFFFFILLHNGNDSNPTTVRFKTGAVLARLANIGPVQAFTAVPFELFWPQNHY